MATQWSFGDTFVAALNQGLERRAESADRAQRERQQGLYARLEQARLEQAFRIAEMQDARAASTEDRLREGLLEQRRQFDTGLIPMQSPSTPAPAMGGQASLGQFAQASDVPVVTPPHMVTPQAFSALQEEAERRRRLSQQVSVPMFGQQVQLDPATAANVHNTMQYARASGVDAPTAGQRDASAARAEVGKLSMADALEGFNRLDRMLGEGTMNRGGVATDIDSETFVNMQALRDAYRQQLLKLGYSEGALRTYIAAQRRSNYGEGGGASVRIE